jgi:tetratricopeptide (TPR) repeat protein
VRAAAALIVCAGLIPAAELPKGFDHFYNLEYDQAVSEFERAIAAAPDRPERYNHLAQALLYREMFKAGALESELVTGANPFLRRGKLEPPPEVEKRFMDSIASAMRVSKEKLAADPKGVPAQFALAVAHGLRGNWNFLVRKAYMESLRDLTASRKLCNQVLALQPAFVDAKLVEGVHDYVVGSLPFYVKMMGFLAGFVGDKEGGIRLLQEVAGRGVQNEVDAKVLLGVVYRRERRPAEAIPLLDGLIARFPRNYLFRMELGQMWADQGDKDKALAAIDGVETLRRAGVTGYGALVEEKIAYARGNILFWYRDLEQAERELLRATAGAARLDLHTASMSWLRLGQTRDLRGSRAPALEAYRRVAAVAPQSDAAKEAGRYINSPYRRDKR